MSTTQPASATVDIPTGTWTIDPSHSSLEAVARHLVVSKVRGRFAAVSGTVEVPEDPTASTVEVTIDAATIDTGDVQRDEHLRSADFLDVDSHPELTFRAGRAVHVDGERWEIPGELTIRGVTRPVTLQATYLGRHQDPWGNDRLVVDGTAEIDRGDFGITWNQALETGGVLVSRKLQIEITVQLVQA